MVKSLHTRCEMLEAAGGLGFTEWEKAKYLHLTLIRLALDHDLLVASRYQSTYYTKLLPFARELAELGEPFALSIVKWSEIAKAEGREWDWEWNREGLEGDPNAVTLH